ncbi:RNA-binding S4 domain-containing protein [Aureimonas psammosilenae]|uniref:RNA-binding S4 domain-containing protein n=1 Tax=Aureimonas psammosilenae TaxID=2495496 RepID=UPI001260BEBB|nr:RNA-binding S4 domain-containing protein [Aureimonas psammosilenae]
MSEGQRIDKWLFFARVVKSRSLAQKLAVSGAVRVNREKIASASRLVRPGDVLTLSMPREIRVLRILDGGERRGPASEAQRLYEDLGRETAPADAGGAPSEVEKAVPSQNGSEPV